MKHSDMIRRQASALNEACTHILSEAIQALHELQLRAEALICQAGNLDHIANEMDRTAPPKRGPGRPRKNPQTLTTPDGVPMEVEEPDDEAEE